MRFHLDVPTMRAMVWANRALGQVRRQLNSGQIQDLQVTPAPRLPRTAALGVSEVLRRRRTTCLEEVLVIQRWMVAQDEPVDVVVGVKPGEDLDLFRAHAWLDGDQTVEEGYEELFRVAPR